MRPLETHYVWTIYHKSWWISNKSNNWFIHIHQWPILVIFSGWKQNLMCDLMVVCVSSVKIFRLTTWTVDQTGFWSTKNINFFHCLWLALQLSLQATLFLVYVSFAMKDTQYLILNNPTYSVSVTVHTRWK